MKVTALIPDDIINEVKKYAGGRTLTDSLIVALKEWLSIIKIKRLNRQIAISPLQFKDDISASKIRSINRKR